MRYLFLLLILINLSHAGKLKEYLEEASLKERILEEIASLEIGFGADLLDLDVLEGAGIGVKYKYEVEPSYMESYYSRVDRWTLKANLRPGDFIKEFDLPISLNFDTGTEILFVRQFPSQKKALKAIPYTPKRIPFRAKWAIENLVPGDFVSMPTHLNIVLSAGISTAEAGLTAGGSTHYILSGKFMVHLFRLAGNRIRMRIIAQRTKGVGANAKAGLDFEIFGIRIIDRQIKKIFELDLGRIDINKQWGDLFLLDYLLDLDDVDAKKAYNQVLNSTLKFKSLKVLNPFASNKSLEQQLVSDLTLLEELREEDLESDQKRVERFFRGKNEYDRQSSKTKIGLILAKFERERVFNQNHIVHYNDQNQEEHFDFSSYSYDKSHKVLWGLMKKSNVFSVSSLLPTNAKKEVQGFSDLAVSLDSREKRVWGFEMQELKELLHRNIGSEVYKEIQWGDFEQNRLIRNSRLFYQVFFHEDAVKIFQNYPVDKLKDKLTEYIQTVPMPHVNQNNKQQHSKLPNWKAWRNRNSWNIRKFIRGISKAFETPHDSAGKNYKYFEDQILELRKNTTFQKLGTGFMTYLLPKDKLRDLVYVNFRWDAKELESLRFSYGEHPKSDLYRELEYVQSILNNRSFDMRLNEVDERSVFEAPEQPDLSGTEENRGALDEAYENVK